MSLQPVTTVSSGENSRNLKIYENIKTSLKNIITDWAKLDN